MHLNPDFEIPVSFFLRLNSESTDKDRALNGLIGGAQKQASIFVASAALFHHCQDMHLKNDQRIWGDWQHIAARSAIFAAHDFGVSISDIRKLWFESKEKPNDKIRKNFKNIFAVYKNGFPNIANARDGIAHPELFSRADRKSQKDGPFEVPYIYVSDISTNITISDMIADDKYIFTFKGEVIECEISTRTMETIKSVYCSVLDEIDVGYG